MVRKVVLPDDVPDQLSKEYLPSARNVFEVCALYGALGL